ncbi:DUF411 domain-containing protein (plasmid) [Xanthomonas sp. NCPPB 3583]|uniref:DUF411 domain-containing protein n=1 Tax=Xanthomonas sp. NCPPB 3583 TaxID=487558 RepID=UPI003556FC91
MNIRSSLLMLGALTGTTTMMACTRSPQPINAAAPPSSQPAAAKAATASLALPQVVVHKSPSCRCCALWVKHLRDAGFVVDVRNEDNLNPIKERVGVPYGKGSCHTAQVGSYFVEGHVPAEDIKRLLAQRPDAKGLVLPGMPMGSPGMEMPDGRTQPYTVGLVERDGRTTAFASH